MRMVNYETQPQHPGFYSSELQTMLTRLNVILRKRGRTARLYNSSEALFRLGEGTFKQGVFTLPAYGFQGLQNLSFRYGTPRLKLLEITFSPACVVDALENLMYGILDAILGTYSHNPNTAYDFRVRSRAPRGSENFHIVSVALTSFSWCREVEEVFLALRSPEMSEEAVDRRVAHFERASRTRIQSTVTGRFLSSIPRPTIGGHRYLSETFSDVLRTSTEPAPPLMPLYSIGITCSKCPREKLLNFVRVNGSEILCTKCHVPEKCADCNQTELSEFYTSQRDDRKICGDCYAKLRSASLAREKGFKINGEEYVDAKAEAKVDADRLKERRIMNSMTHAAGLFRDGIVTSKRQAARLMRGAGCRYVAEALKRADFGKEKPLKACPTISLRGIRASWDEVVARANATYRMPIIEDSPSARAVGSPPALGAPYDATSTRRSAPGLAVPGTIHSLIITPEDDIDPNDMEVRDREAEGLMEDPDCWWE